MIKQRFRLFPALIILILLVFPAISVSSKATLTTEDDPPPSSDAQPVVVYATRSDSYGPLRDIKPRPPRWSGYWNSQSKTLPNRPGESDEPTGGPIQEGIIGTSAASIGVNFEGVNNRNGAYPPDTQGDVGPNHYVQVVNISFQIWNKDGTTAYGPANINTLWNGFGGPCENTNDGDPIALYDHLADRWLISQFALPNYPQGPFYQCIAISQTADPTGAYYRYEFTWSADKMNDYPKFGVWPDGYYMAVNQFTETDLDWAGQGVAVFERDQMLNGNPARMIQFDLYSQNSDLGGMLPSDLDGPLPPDGAPNVFIEVDDDAWGFPNDQFSVFEFHTDWTTPGNSTFNQVATLNTAPYDSDMCGDNSRNCIPQPSGTNLDSISDRLMYRLQYRNFGDYQTLVVNHTVDVDGTDHAGIRWYELRNTGAGWNIYQQSTFAPDANHRWMASVAMNKKGEMALGYSISSTSIYPSIRFTGRLDGDPLDQMTQGETEIIAGSGAQYGPDGRWGDYSMMSVDPVDDCTFWYTTEYYTTNSYNSWQTRIASFQLTNCEATETHTLPFSAGWTLITLPLEPETAYTAQSLLDEINAAGGSCSEIDRWYNSGWDSHVDGAAFNNFDIIMGDGYFVKCSVYDDWTQTGYPLSSSIQLNLVAGWNLLGIPYPESAYTAQGLLDDINSQGGACSEVDRWYNSGWSSHVDGLPFSDFDILTDQGYFVKCSQSSSFTPGG
jgi:hypothetical protein